MLLPITMAVWTINVSFSSFFVHLLAFIIISPATNIIINHIYSIELKLPSPFKFVLEYIPVLWIWWIPVINHLIWIVP